MAATPDFLDLYDYRRRVTGLYRDRNDAAARGAEPTQTLHEFRSARDVLFASHPQSALDEQARTAFRGLSYFPYNPDAQVEGEINREVEQVRITLQTADDESLSMVRCCTVTFTLLGHVGVLSVFWLDGYGGGLFLPFVDATAPHESYGGGRYLFDTVKGSDFVWNNNGNGISTRVTLDFNYAYNPSCAYDPRWACPLAPRENRLSFPVRAGEKHFTLEVLS